MNDLILRSIEKFHTEKKTFSENYEKVLYIKGSP